MKKLLASFSLAVAALFGASAHATSVVPLYLDEIADRAAVAFEGTVLKNETVRDAATQAVVTYTTFQVRDVIKGAVGSTHTIKQIGGAIPGEAVQYRVQGIPTFNVGQEYVVFLAAPSSLGFSSPMGLAQGRFTVHDGPNAKQVSNGRDFRDLTERISAKVPAAARDHIKNSGGPVRALDIDDFKKTVRAHLGAKP